MPMTRVMALAGMLVPWPGSCTNCQILASPEKSSVSVLSGASRQLRANTDQSEALQGRPWAIWVNLGMQLVLIAGWFVSGAVGFIGLVFAGVWLLILYLRSEVKRREERGLLPGQQSPPD